MEVDLQHIDTGEISGVSLKLWGILIGTYALTERRWIGHWIMISNFLRLPLASRCSSSPILQSQSLVEMIKGDIILASLHTQSDLELVFDLEVCPCMITGEINASRTVGKLNKV
jgi:hypothetical protein